jgi:hypothetical protein
MDRCTFIMRFEALLQVDGEADIALAGMGVLITIISGVSQLKLEATAPALVR